VTGLERVRCTGARVDDTGLVHITARADYAVRAAIRLALAGEGPAKGAAIAAAEDIPAKFLEEVLRSLRNAGLVNSQRGTEGGYWLARPAETITVADIVRAADGPLASVRGERPERTSYTGPAAPLRDVWIAVRVSLREVLEAVTLADLAAGTLPEAVCVRVAAPDAWVTR
jgi:Rrf2 family protein